MDEEIRERVAAFLRGEITLEALEDWFVAESWDERTPLVVQLDHLLAERNAAGMEQFLEELRLLRSTVRVGPGAQIVTQSSSITLRPSRVVTTGSETIIRQLAFAGRQRAVGPE